MNCGEFLAKATGGILISYKEHGDYQGDYVAIIEKGSDWLIYNGRYGSCSGCDWLEDKRIYSDEDYARLDEAEYGDESDRLEETFKFKPEVVKEYLDDNPPFLVIPKSQLPDSLEDLKALLPANTRTIMDEDYNDVDLDAVVFEQLKHFEFDTLEYLEKKSEGK